jgi:hypothetical protein
MMSPHDQPWLDDYETRQRVELQAKWDSEGEVFRIQNQAMKTVLRECPDPLRKPENCENCGNENCIKAWKEQNSQKIKNYLPQLPDTPTPPCSRRPRSQMQRPKTRTRHRASSLAHLHLVQVFSI